jgi:arabinofuranosyltransferase
VLLALWYPATFRSNERWDCVIPLNGIANERPCYAEYTGLAQNVSAQLPRKYTLHGRFKRGLELRRKPGQVLTSTNVGIMGFAAGPRVHIIDAMALTDPLLARIPYANDPGFRIGHFQREAPAGYEQSLRGGVNVIKDPCIHAYYDVLSPVIRGPLFTWARVRAIVALNFGRYDYLMRQPCKSVL